MSFDKPITGIVGPNGSGKSNIVDALLWVMGEQSTKNLRGGKMEDVIFGGTQRRNQLGFAEVSLILDNSEGKLAIETSEVMLTRRYYRSGESEYYINRSIVRLKDMTDLLMDTGLGRDGYSIIGQGRIAEILSSKSKDRREIFEEAAGISRYRHRKDESERKLQQAEENLLQVGYIISELELQRNPLKEQAEVAKKFQNLSFELRGLEISLWLKELDTLKNRADKTQTDLTTAKLAVDKAELDLEEIHSKFEALEETSRNTDIEAESIRELISSSELRHSEVEGNMTVLKSQIESNSGQIERLSEEIQSREESQDGVGAQISERENKLLEISNEKAEKAEKIDKLIAELQDISNSTGESSKAQSELITKENDLQAAHSDKRSELSALASQAQELYDAENSVKKELAAAKEETEGHIKAEKDITESLQKSIDEVTSLKNVVSGLALKAENRRKKAEESQKVVDRLASERKELEARKRLLSELEKEYKGYSKSVRLVMQEHSRGWLKGVQGTVGELLKTDDNYTIAIEIALGSAMQNIIVNSDADGKAAINFLKQRDGGRATFLPISTIKGDRLNESDFRGNPGFEGVAFDLVTADPKFSGIYSRLLGRVIIVDNLDNAMKLAKAHGNRYRVVTLDGQVVNAGGSLTGGSSGNNVGMLSRANELRTLDTRIKAVAADLMTAERANSECLREKTAAEYELSTARTELRTAEEKVMRKEIECTHRRELLKVSQAHITNLGKELDVIVVRVSDNSGETKSVKSMITELETEITAMKELIEEAIRGQELLTGERERVNLAISELRAETAALDAKSEELAKSVSELCIIRDEMKGSRERQLESIEELENKNKQIHNEITAHEQKTAKILSELHTQRELLSKLNERKLEIEAQRTNSNKTIQKMNNDVRDMETERLRLESRAESIKTEEMTLLAKLWDKYNLAKTAAVNEGSPIENVTAARKRINSINAEIDELGEVNIGAIKEYERVSERYDFFITQRSDAEDAKNKLLEIIGDITSSMREKFSREFALINTHFERTFKELFEGGKASLILEDPVDVLNSGIEIQVQPPGKSVRTISLLSGGEKAFVAIAIYFAILAVRPPPFVVMDEIDAALDDANALRFADHMRRMSDKTQMVVISHKRRTMEEADVLYGVTMQELGVSSLLCIDLDEAEKHIQTKASA